jgi:outer membrane receptor protein involved in Fe transport
VIQALTLALMFTWPVPFTAPLAQADEPPLAQAEDPPVESSETPAADPEPPPDPSPSPAPASPPPARLEPVHAAQTETVVRAAPAAPRADQAATVSVVVPDDSPRAYDDLAALLAEVPGVNVVRTGSLGKLTTITLRGSNPDQVRIYVDGVPINIAAGGGVDVSTLPIGDVERVEVYRGSAPLEFGESALGGIIAITTRTPGVVRASARTGAGSFGTMFGDVSGGGRVGRLRLYAGLHGFSARGDFPYVNDNMTALNPADDVTLPRPNNDVLQGDGVLRAELALAGRRTLDLGAIGFGRDEGLPGTGGSPTRSARFQTTRGLAYLHYRSRDDLGAGGRLSARLFASWQRDRLNDRARELGMGGASLTHDTTTVVGANAHAARPVGEWARIAAVLEGRHEGYQPVNDLAAVPAGVPARRLTGVAGAEIDLRWRWAALDFIPSARIEVMQDAVSRRDARDVPLPDTPAVFHRSPVLRAAVVRPLVDRPTLKVDAKANVGRYARVPSFVELYGNGTAFVLGNADLVPEQGTNVDVGISIDRMGDWLGLTSRTTLFGARVDDLIQWQYSSWGQARADNLGRARIAGVEQELRLLLGRWGRLVGQGTYLDARDESDNAATNGKQLPYHPRWRAYLRPELVRIRMPGGLELGAYADAEGRLQSYRDGANLVNSQPRVLVGCGLSLAAPRARLRLTASVANLTNTRLEDVDSGALPGRAAFVALAYAPVGGEGGGAAIFDPRYAQ